MVLMTLKNGANVPFNEFQKNFVRKQKLPYGTTFQLRHRKTDRLARASEKMVIQGTSKGLARDHETLNDLILNRLIPSLKNPASIEKYSVQIKGPNGELPKGKNILVGTIRGWLGQATPEEIEAQIEAEANIDDASQAFDLNSINYCRNPEDVMRGVMRKMLTQFSAEELQQALAEEIGKKNF